MTILLEAPSEWCPFAAIVFDDIEPGAAFPCLRSVCAKWRTSLDGTDTEPGFCEMIGPVRFEAERPE